GPLDLSNMTTVQTFTGSFDESWFYLITAAVEARSASVVGDIPELLAAIADHDHPTLLAKLQNLHHVLSDLPAVLNEMYKHCDPYVFYWRIHPYLAGWSNMASAGLPHGLLYRGVDDCDVDPSDEAAL
ncbi:tryptophan 2,3- dioxygenase, partial [Dimargaris verticillata]